jgi:RNA polymerase sigma-70 factor (sigma-E family)
MSQGPDGTSPHAEFTAFAEACQLRMVRAAYLICGDRHLAEDLTQTALIKVALRWSQVRDGQPEAYLRTILYRDAVSWWRRRRREVLVADPPERRDLADDAGERAQLRVIFARALARLTPRQRAVLVLRFYEDLGEAQIADVMGIAVGTVKSQTGVALRRLRQVAPELADLVGDSEGGRR